MDKSEEQLVKRLYKIQDYLKIMKDVMEDTIEQTHFLTNDELLYDRMEFMRVTKDFELSDSKGFYNYQTDIHTISILMVQLVKYGKIYYNNIREKNNERFINSKSEG